MNDSKGKDNPKKEINLAKEEKLRKELIRRAAREEARRKVEKIKEGKRKIVSIVEEIVDKKIDEASLIEHCKFLCKQDYEDVNVERSLVNICGYPLCFANLPKPCKQRYHISLAEHKVYDLSERKLFCSNLCYKASCFLKEQLDEEPFWMRSNTSVTPVSVKIYHDTKGARGAEVLMVPRVETDNDHENNKENDHEMFAEAGEDDLSENLPKKRQETRLKSTFVASPYIKEKDLTKFAESMKKLTIKERE